MAEVLKYVAINDFKIESNISINDDSLVINLYDYLNWDEYYLSYTQMGNQVLYVSLSEEINFGRYNGPVSGAKIGFYKDLTGLVQSIVFVYFGKNVLDTSLHEAEILAFKGMLFSYSTDGYFNFALSFNAGNVTSDLWIDSTAYQSNLSPRRVRCYWITITYPCPGGGGGKGDDGPHKKIPPPRAFRGDICFKNIWVCEQEEDDPGGAGGTGGNEEGGSGGGGGSGTGTPGGGGNSSDGKIPINEADFDIDLVLDGSIGLDLFLKRGGQLPSGWNSIDLRALLSLIAEYQPDVLVIQDILQNCAMVTDKIKCAKDFMAMTKHQQLHTKYSAYRQENINISSFLQSYDAYVYLASAVLFENYMDEVGIPPTFPYQWQLMAEEFIETVGPVIPEFIPTIGDFIGAYNDFQQGQYFMSSVTLLIGIFTPNEIGKVFKNAPTIKKGWSRVIKVAELTEYFQNVPGAMKIFNKLPDTWKNIKGSKLLSDTDKGFRWVKESNHVLRVMQPSTKTPYNYGRFFKNGSYYDINKNPVYESNDPASHIDLNLITDDFLEWFFN